MFISVKAGWQIKLSLFLSRFYCRLLQLTVLDSRGSWPLLAKAQLIHRGSMKDTML